MGLAQSGMPADRTSVIPKQGIGVAPRGQLPKDVIPLSDAEVFKIQEKITKAWEPQKEVFVLRHAHTLLGATTSITAFYMNDFWRKAFRLRDRAPRMTVVPTLVIPAIATAFSYHAFVQVPLWLKKMPCALCAELRAVSIQTSLGVGMPLVLGGLSGAVAAKMVHSYAVPSVIHAPRDTFAMFRKMAAKGRTSILVALALNAVIAYQMTYKVGYQAALVHDKMRATSFGVASTLPKDKTETNDEETFEETQKGRNL